MEFKEMEPQINADERGFIAMHLRLFAFICGLKNYKRPDNHI